MKKKTAITRSPEETVIYDDYKEFLGQCENDIDAIIREIDAKFLNNTSEKIPHEIKFDVVPLFKKLKMAQKEARVTRALQG